MATAQNNGNPGQKGRRKGDFSKFMRKKSLTSSEKTARRIKEKFESENTSRAGKKSKSATLMKERGVTVKSETVRLNKYISNSGYCSRREADQLIVSGAVKVNGVTVTELGTKIHPGDKVQIGDLTLKPEKLRYVLLNKPKGYITSTKDPQKRNTVMALVADACKERIYPVGRLDRNTTGLLLFTNDGELARKLTHPRSRITKIYHVYLDKNLTKNDMKQIAEGIQLEDGFFKVDGIAYVGDGKDKKDIGLEIHSGKNRIIRRLFEALGYKVVKLDRVMFAGLTKKDLPRGKYRHLTPQEVAFLKMLGPTK